MKKITSIDLWSMDSTVEDILEPAIYDVFYASGKPLYNTVRVYTNANVEYFIGKKLVNSYHDVVLFLDDENPVRIVFLRRIGKEKAEDIVLQVKKAFDIKCLPGDVSVNDQVAEGKMSITWKDLKQQLGKEVIDKQLGSCGTIGLLTAMLAGTKTEDGSGAKNIKGDVSFDSEFELIVKIALDEYEVAIRHQGLFDYELAEAVDTGRGVIQDRRWIIIQDSFNHDEFKHIITELNK